MNPQTSKSPHILNTSATLLGLCFIVLSSIKALRLSEATTIDSFTAVAAVLFMASSLLSFLAMRSKTSRGVQLESVADYVFLTGLLSLFLTIMLIIFNQIK